MASWTTETSCTTPQSDAWQHSLALTADSALRPGGHGCLGHGEDRSIQLLPTMVELEAWAPGQ